MTRNGSGYLLEKAGMQWFIDHYVPDEAQRTDPRCSPILGDLTGQPPALVLTAEYDPLLDDGKDHAAALERAGVEVDYEMVEGQVHTFFTQVGVVGASMESVMRIAAFLDLHSVTTPPFSVQDHPPTMRPSAQMVGPMLPFRSKSGAS